MKGIKMAYEMKNRTYISRGYLYLGDLYNDMDRKDEELNYLKKAEGLFREMGMDYHISKTLDVLRRI